MYEELCQVCMYDDMACRMYNFIYFIFFHLNVFFSFPFCVLKSCS